MDGKVTTSLNHERSGHTKLARMVDNHDQLDEIFSNPRVHTSRGRHVGQSWLQNDSADREFWDSGYTSGESRRGRSPQELCPSIDDESRGWIREDRSRSVSPSTSIRLYKDWRGSGDHSEDRTLGPRRDERGVSITERESRHGRERERDRGRERESRDERKREKERERERKERKRRRDKKERRRRRDREASLERKDKLLLMQKYVVKQDTSPKEISLDVAQPSVPAPILRVTVAPQSETARTVNFSPLSPSAEPHSAVIAQQGVPEVRPKTEERKEEVTQIDEKIGKERVLKRKRTEDGVEDENNERSKKLKNNNYPAVSIYNCLKNSLAHVGSILMKGFTKIFKK